MIFEYKPYYNKTQRRLVDYLNGINDSYDLISNKYYFIITKTDKKNEYENIINTYETIFQDCISLIYDDSIISFFIKREKIYIKEIIETLEEDLGFKLIVFEGFKIDINKENIISILKYVKYNLLKEYTYAKVSDLILQNSFNNDLKENIKTILLKDYLKKDDFLTIVKAMFLNNLNVSKTANSIYMHRNTLNNKIDMFELSTSLELRSFKDSLVIYELLKNEINF